MDDGDESTGATGITLLVAGAAVEVELVLEGV